MGRTIDLLPQRGILLGKLHSNFLTIPLFASQSDSLNKTNARQALFVHGSCKTP